MRTWLLGIPCLLVSVAQAQVSAPIESCRDRPTSEQVECFADVEQRANVLLNERFQRLLREAHVVNPSLPQRLRAAQRGWIAFRDNDCAFVRDGQSGSLARVAYAECKAIHTTRRANDLDYSIDNGISRSVGPASSTGCSVESAVTCSNGKCASIETPKVTFGGEVFVPSHRVRVCFADKCLDGTPTVRSTSDATGYTVTSILRNPSELGGYPKRLFFHFTWPDTRFTPRHFSLLRETEDGEGAVDLFFGGCVAAGRAGAPR